MLRALVAGWVRSRIWRSRLAMALALVVALVMVVFLRRAGCRMPSPRPWWKLWRKDPVPEVPGHCGGPAERRVTAGTWC